TFEYSDLRVHPAADGGATVGCRVRNTGKRDGDTVVQAYLGAPSPSPAGVDFPARALAAFERVRVKAGAMREVRLQIAPRRLGSWSAAAHAWVVAGRGRPLYVGASSRDLPLSAPLSADPADPVDLQGAAQAARVAPTKAGAVAPAQAGGAAA